MKLNRKLFRILCCLLQIFSGILAIILSILRILSDKHQGLALLINIPGGTLMIINGVLFSLIPVVEKNGGACLHNVCQLLCFVPLCPPLLGVMFFTNVLSGEALEMLAPCVLYVGSLILLGIAGGFKFCVSSHDDEDDTPPPSTVEGHSARNVSSFESSAISLPPPSYSSLYRENKKFTSPVSHDFY